MKLYYRAVDSEGKTISGLIDARDVKEVAYYLKGHNMYPIKITPAGEKIKVSIPFLNNKPKSQDRIFFTSQLASMLSSGLTLMQALRVLKDQVKNPAMAGVIEDIIAGVESGKVFSAALMKYPEVFPPIYISLIRTAESSGLLDKVLLRMADNLEKQEKLHKTIRGALTYPAVVMVVMLLVVLIMLLFVIPQLRGLYENINVELPFSTKLVLGASELFGKIWYLIILGLFIMGYYARQFYKSDGGRRIVDGYILKMPIFGKLLTQTMMAEFTRTLGLLIGSGSLVVDSLVKTSDVLGNKLYKDAILLISKRVEKGITVSDSMSASPLFPSMIVEMVRVGEQTGKLDESLLRAAEYYEREVDQMVKNLTTLLEPIIIVILAIGVGFLIFSIITPIYGLISSLQ